MDSDGNATDDSSKRRRSEDIEETYRRSSKMRRTPSKTGKTEDEKLDILIGMISGMRIEVDKIRKEQEKFNEEIKQIKRENEDLRKENRSIKEENKKITTMLGTMQMQMEKIEKEKRKKNVVVTGISIDTNNENILKQVIANMLKDELKITVHVSSVHKLGDAACLVELEKEEDKAEIMRNKYKLKELKDRKIFINNDLTQMEREKEREIRKIAQIERSKGNTVKIGYNKINVGEEEWRWNNETKKLEKRQPKNQWKTTNGGCKMK